MFQIRMHRTGKHRLLQTIQRHRGSNHSLTRRFSKYLLNELREDEGEGEAQMATRRDWLRLASGSFSLLLPPARHDANAAAGQVSAPDPKQFQSGDFLWPKKPGVFVPYDAGPPRAQDADEAKWTEERDRFVANVITKAPYFTPAQTEKMRRLTYSEFHSAYTGARRTKSGTYSSVGPIYVGHVGIVEIDEAGVPWVIEALWGRGVIRHTYADWLAERTGEVVWLGRLTKLSAAQRARIPVEARRQLGKPYDFWNFDLNDESGFYCSKLAWMAAFRSLNLAVDGNPNPSALLLVFAEAILVCSPYGPPD